MKSSQIAKQQLPSVGFVIILHGDPVFFRDTLASIAKQKCHPDLAWRVYCFDDGTSPVALSQAKQMGCEVFPLPEGSGIASAKLFATNVVKENMIFFLDSHMLLDLHALQRAVDILQSDPTLSGVCGCYRAATASDFDRLRDLKRHVLFEKGDVGREISSKQFTTFSMGLGMLWRRVLQDMPFPSELFLRNLGGEDLPFLVTLLGSGKRLYYSPSVIAVHCHRMVFRDFLRKIHIEVAGRFPVYYWLCVTGNTRVPFLPGFLTFPLLLACLIVLAATAVACRQTGLAVGLFIAGGLFEGVIPARVLFYNKGDWTAAERLSSFLYLMTSEMLTLIYAFTILLPRKVRPGIRHLAWRPSLYFQLLALFASWEGQKLQRNFINIVRLLSICSVKQKG